MSLSELEIILRHDPYNPFLSDLKLAIEMYVEKEFKSTIPVPTAKYIQARKKYPPIRKNKPVPIKHKNIKQPTIKNPTKYIPCVRK